MSFSNRLLFLIRFLFVFLFFLLSSSQVFPQASMDIPHDTQGCKSCHDMAAYDQPNLIPNPSVPLPYVPLNIDDTVYNQTCNVCHLTGPATLATTHSSLATSNNHGDWSVGCSVCHNQHIQEQPGRKFIRTTIDLSKIDGVVKDINGDPVPKTGWKRVIFAGDPDLADGDIVYNGICEVCHTQTRHFRNNGLATDQLHSIDENGTPAKVGPGNDCTMCHKHKNGFTVNMPSHSATPGSDWVLVFEEGTHDSVMNYDGEVNVECQMCHNTKLSDAHDYQCLLCHPSPAGAIVGSWSGGCQQGGCHVSIHSDVSAAHNAAADDYPDEWDYCTQCHEYPDPPGDWWPTSAACPNCHAVYNPADNTPPVTTSNAKSSYLGPARIEYTVRDSGKVVVAQSYSSVDDGPEEMGSTIVVSETGSHNLKFWSVDQANNTESPNSVNFEILQDTTPPVTTSDAKSLPYIYYNAARIWFSSSDDGELGVKTTYYSLDGGPTETGSSVYVSGALGTVNHTLKFWSEDWSGNVENSDAPEHNPTFTISKGTGTFRMWGGGTSCANDPDPNAYWVIYKDGYGGEIVAEGTDGCDVVLPVSATGYYVMVYWWNDGYDPGFWDEEYYPGNLYYLKTNGDLIELN